MVADLYTSTHKLHPMICRRTLGVGRTSLARPAARVFDRASIALSALCLGVKDTHAALAQAELNRALGLALLLLIDEIHRVNPAGKNPIKQQIIKPVVPWCGRFRCSMGVSYG